MDWPAERLHFFRAEIGIDGELEATIAPHAEAIAGHSGRMADYLWDHIQEMAQAKIVIDRETTKHRLQHNWRGLFEAMWTSPLSDAFLAALWRSGFRHVRHGVDHRFINLAYSHVRSWCHEIIHEVAAEDERQALVRAANKLIDLSLLVETDAFLAAGNMCEHEMMMGIAHQMRNPIMVIGVNAASMLRAIDNGGTSKDKLEAVFDESRRLERMVRDVGGYVATLRREPVFREVDLEQMSRMALQEAQGQGWPEGLEPRFEIEKGELMAEADAEMIALALTHVVQNAVEAQTDAAEPRLVIRAGAAADPHFSVLEIESGGEPPSLSEEELFIPFHSSKPYGTGLGLSIARMAARKNFGQIELTRLSDGALSRLTLPRPGAVHETGLFFKG
jgi:signal transduction histidine kinase